jgi:hypothetical protein
VFFGITISKSPLEVTCVLVPVTRWSTWSLAKDVRPHWEAELLTTSCVDCRTFVLPQKKQVFVVIWLHELTKDLLELLPNALFMHLVLVPEQPLRVFTTRKRLLVLCTPPASEAVARSVLPAPVDVVDSLSTSPNVAVPFCVDLVAEVSRPVPVTTIPWFRTGFPNASTA